MKFIQDDGGRKAAGFKGNAGDCVTRSICIATGQPYIDVYKAMAEGNQGQRATAGRAAGKRTARSGIHTKRKWFKDYMASIGWVWTPTMHIGSGCKVHLVAGELPAGRLIVAVSKHYTAVIDGVIRDTFDPQRTSVSHETGATSDRCVYGYWSQK